MRRRDFVKTATLATAASALGPAKEARTAVKETQTVPDADAKRARPNILVVMTDDHAQWASSCYGNHELRTPTFDYLAATGARMMNAYTPCPVCSPARASFWTGTMPSQHGIHDWIHETTHPQVWLGKERTLPEVLHANGYQTAFAGKWHCGQSWVPQAGFDYYLGENRDQYPHRGLCHFTEKGKPVEYVGQRSAFLTEKALDFLQHRDRTRPFFLFVGYVDTHSPFSSHPERWASTYRAPDIRFVDIPDEHYVGPGRALHKPPAQAEVRRESLAEYYAAVSYVDEQTGQLLDALDGSGDLETTLVVYLSDHGHMNGHHGLYTKGNATVPQNFYEESIRTQCLLRWPGPIAPGTVSAIPVSHCDTFQTLLDAAGCTERGAAAAARNSPGHSYLPLLQGKNTTTPFLPSPYFCEYGNARMVREDRYKLIVRYAPHAGVFPDELYDLSIDPRETQNRITDPGLQETIKRLRGQLDAFFAQYETPEYSGKEIVRQPSYNNSAEPWRQPLT